MKKLGFILSLFATTSTLAVPPYFTLDGDRAEDTMAALRAVPKFQTFTEILTRYAPGGSAENTHAMDAHVLSAFLPRADDSRDTHHHRGELFGLLTANGFMEVLDGWDEESCTFNYDPGRVMSELLQSAHPAVLHIGTRFEAPLDRDGDLDPYFPWSSYVGAYPDLWGMVTEGDIKKQEAFPAVTREDTLRLQQHWEQHGSATEGRITIGYVQPNEAHFCISDQPCATPHPLILTNSFDYRPFSILVEQGSVEALPPLHTIVLHGHVHDGDIKLPRMFNDPSFRDWLTRLLFTVEKRVAQLQITGLGDLNAISPHSLDALKRILLPHGFMYFSARPEHGSLNFLSFPAPELTIPADFSHESHAEANQGVYTPLREADAKRATVSHVGSPLKQDVTLSRRRYLERSEAKFLQSRGSNPYLEGIPRGFRPEHFLRLNPEVFQAVLTEFPLPQLAFPGPLATQFKHQYGHWLANIYRKSQEIFLRSFTPRSGYEQYKGLPFMTDTPEGFNWLRYIQNHPHILINILRQGHVQLLFGNKPPKEEAEAKNIAQNLNAFIDEKNQRLLAVAVNKLVSDGISRFAKGQRQRHLHVAPWKPTPWGLDLIVFADSIERLGVFGPFWKSPRTEFMLDRGYSERNMKKPLAAMEYLEYLQDLANGFAENTSLGYSYLPHMPPGVVECAYRNQLFPQFIQALRDAGNDLETLFAFGVLDQFDELTAFLPPQGTQLPAPGVELGSQEMNVPLTPEVTNLRQFYLIWAQLAILDSVYTPDSPWKVWWHPTATLAPAPESYDWRNLRALNPDNPQLCDSEQAQTWLAEHTPKLTLQDQFEASMSSSSGSADDGDEEGSGCVVVKPLESIGSLSSEAEAVFASWAQHIWWKMNSSGEMGLNVHERTGNDFDPYALIRRLRESAVMRDHHATLQRIQDGELQGADLTRAIYAITEAAADQQRILYDAERRRQEEAEAAEAEEQRRREAEAAEAEEQRRREAKASEADRRRREAEAAAVVEATAAEAGRRSEEILGERAPLLSTQAGSGQSGHSHDGDDDGGGCCCVIS